MKDTRYAGPVVSKTRTCRKYRAYNSNARHRHWLWSHSRINSDQETPKTDTTAQRPTREGRTARKHNTLRTRGLGSWKSSNEETQENNIAALKDEATKKKYVTAVTERLTNLLEIPSIQLMTNIIRDCAETEIGLAHPDTRTWMSENQTAIRHLSESRQRAFREHNQTKMPGA